MGGGHDVDLELARLKGELSQGEAPREIEGSAADGAASQGETQADLQAQPADQPQAGDGS